MKIKIGDVVVMEGLPPAGNPYRNVADHLSGEFRSNALKRFRDGKGAASAFSFWFAPTNGGARQITDPSEIDWSGMRP